MKPSDQKECVRKTIEGYVKLRKRLNGDRLDDKVQLEDVRILKKAVKQSLELSASKQ